MASALSGHSGAFYAAMTDCVLFSATNNTITVADPTGGELDFGATDSFSIECWVKPAATGDGVLVEKHTGTVGVDHLGYKLLIDASGFAEFVIGDATNARETTITDNLDLTDGAWHHIIAVRDVTNDQLELWVDGASAIANVTDATTGTLAQAGDLVIGQGTVTTTANTRHFGLTRIYSADVGAFAAQLYAGQYPDVNTYPIVGEWFMLEGTGATVYDNSTNDNDGTIANATWASAATTITTDSTTGSGVSWACDTATNVDETGMIVYDSGRSPTTLKPGDWSTTVAGLITLSVAAVGTITATYDDYVCLELGGFTGWTLDYVGEALEKTDFTDSGVRSYIPGITGWSGSADRHWVNNDLADDLASVMIVKLYYFKDTATPASSKRLEGWAVLTGLTYTTAADGLVENGITFTGHSVLTLATS